ncbi:MAG TPA: sialidase family protein [Planctomycetota bacterium]|nr:sialidase family protein [Planctomycetota bacterium]
MRALIISALVIAGACAGEHGGHAAPADGVCSLDACASPDGRMHLLVGTREGDAVRLDHLRSDDRGETWSAAVRVDRADARPAGLRRGADARLIAAGPALVASWCSPGTGWGGSGPLACARSRDGGASWEAAANPADDGSTSGHNFIALAADRNGAVQAVWLDGRAGQQGLIHAATSDLGTTWSPNITVDDTTCACCPNAVAIGVADDLYALYRDRDPRDLVLAAWDAAAGAWQRRGPVGAFDWRFDGCPHSGGALAEGGGVLHALVWTGRAEHVGVHHCSSRDGGRSWTAPNRLSVDGNHPALAWTGAGLVAAWDAAGGIEIATSTDGASWSAPRRIATDIQAQSPVLVATAAGARVFWTHGVPARWASSPVTP